MSLEGITLDVYSLLLHQKTSYAPVACACLFLYDYLLALYDEYCLVWQAPWSFGKSLFILTRYPAFVDISLALYYDVGNSSGAACQTLYKITNWMILIGVVIAELIMIIRIWALWGRSRKVGALLVVAFVVSIVIAAVIFGKFIEKRLFLQLHGISDNLSGCFTIRQTPVFFQGYLLLMAYETLIMILMLAKGIQYFHHGTSTFVYNFYQDGIIYYAALLSISAINVAILRSDTPGLADLFVTPQRTLHSLLSARILLHLRRDYTRHRHHSDTSISLNLDSALTFGGGNPVWDRPAMRRGTEITTWFGE